MPKNLNILFLQIYRFYHHSLPLILFLLSVFYFGDAQCQSGLQSVTFNTPGPTIQNFTVPNGITSITITAVGADGGNALSGNFIGGKGATATATFTVIPNQVLDIVVGEVGASRNPSGGGGGGSGVRDMLSSTVMIVAGGGGGAAGNDNLSGGNGLGGNNNIAGLSGSNAGVTTGFAGGVSGNGGVGSGGGIGGGGGILTPGGVGTDGGSGGFNATGGGTTGSPGGRGIGGGGRGPLGGSGGSGGGGGGGYSGGGGGGFSGGGGGGGGSFIAVTGGNINSGATGGGTQSNGSVTISYVTSTPIPTLNEWALLIFGLLVLNLALFILYKLKVSFIEKR